MHEDFVLANDAVECVDEPFEPVVAHERQLAIPEVALPVEGVGAMGGGADLQRAVEARGLTGGSEKRNEGMRDGEEEEEAVAAVRSPDVRRAEAKAEADVLGVAEGRS